MSPLLLAPLVIVAVLAVSVAAKLRRPEDVASAFSSLRMPAWLDRPVAHRALPIGELVLAVALLVLGGPAGVVVAAAALALMLAYTVVIGRALTFGYPVDCGCFGRLGMGEVTRRTLWRNVLLSLVAAAGVVFAVLHPQGPLRYLVAGGPLLWGWVVAAACAVAVATLIVGGSPTTSRAPVGGGGVVAGVEPGQGDTAGEALEDYGDYVRQPTPPAAVYTGDGVLRSVRDLARRQAQLLVFVSPSCGSCTPVIEKLPELRTRLGPVALREIYVMTHERGVELQDKGLIASVEHALFDPDRMLGTALEISGTPSAVLFGTDDLLAGGPVTGWQSVLDFIDDVAAQVAGVEEEPAGEVDGGESSVGVAR